MKRQLDDIELEEITGFHIFHNSLVVKTKEESYTYEYESSVELLKRISDENKEDGKIIEKAKYDWDITSRNVTHNAGRLKLKRYLSVMANPGLRQKYFGF